MALAASEERVRQPALAEIDEALVPAFIIEELGDGRFTVFVPSVPTPLAGAVYTLSRERMHALNVSLMQAVKVVSQRESEANELVAAMKTEPTMKEELPHGTYASLPYVYPFARTGWTALSR